MRHRMMFIIAILCIAYLAADAQTVTKYQQPPADIVAMLDAAPLPQSDLSPDGRWMLLLHRPSMPSIADLAQPMYRLAGTRISPRTNSRFMTQGINRLTVLDLNTKRTSEISLPANPRLAYVNWSPDAKRLAFVQRLDDGLELWIADPATGRSHKIANLALNATTTTPYRWLPDSSGLICFTVPKGRGPEPKPSEIPVGPKIQESGGQRAPVPTYQDLLQDAHDEALFEHYFTSQLVHLDLASGKTTPVGKPAIFDQVSLSPDGRYILVERVVRPFSYFVPYSRFAQEVEVWDRSGKLVKRIASLPLAERTPTGGVRTGPRGIEWQPDAPATLVYAEALDEGDPRRKVPHRDRVLQLAAPFTAEPRELFRSELRFAGIQWMERNGLAIWREFDRPARKARTYFQDLTRPDAKPRLVFDLQTEDRYKNPGQFVETTNKNGQRVVQQSTDGQYVYLEGQGATPEGDRPFLRRMNIATLETEELFRSADPYYEPVVDVLDADARRIVTSRESVAEPPNLFLRDLDKKTAQALTSFEDPQPLLRKLKKQLVTYKRSDGITLSGTLYLPPDYKQGERRPTVIWAYPNEFASADAASQVRGSPNRFTRVAGASHLFLVLQGYVLLDGAAMPILGGEKANDTFVEQLVKNAEAAIDYLVEEGYTDRDRVGVGGHSYGAFMTANLLAHSDLFRTGIARSGAYNRTLTPFSFQNERRSFWEAPEVYFRMSPFMHAHKVNEPILLIHGEADNNSGTFPMQSERFYHALKGLGRTARYVTFPLESHGYAARESVLHTIYEMITWMDKHVKNAPPRPSQASR
ncbi:MAG TPA: prolyl oligopeptidase family serine peptidase [Blastocatellia bacterium]|nr:prolyl oligopeptidase family serine peptidase [Blastocatellia bacterium]